MEKIIGTRIADFPIKGLKKISDILYFEGPVLTHFVDESENHYLFYWVDFDDELNRWMIFRVELSDLFLYLDGQLNLRNLLKEENNHFLIFADIDEEESIKSSFLTTFKDIDSSYLPEENSYYTFEIKTLYKEMFAEMNLSNDYVHALRQRAINFKVEPLESTYSTTVGLDDAVSFMKRLRTSYSNYVESHFKRLFHNLYVDSTAIAKATKRILELSNPRIVGVAYGSLEVSLATDSIMAEIDNKELKAWQNSVIYHYKNDVIDINYLSVDEFKSKTRDLDAEEVRKIYGPILQLANDPNYSVSVQDRRSNEGPKKLKRVPKKTLKNLIPKADIPVVDEEVQMQLLSMVLEVAKGGGIEKLTLKELKEAILFAEMAENVKMKIDYILSPEGERIDLSSPIEYTESIIGNIYQIKSEILEIEAFGSSHQAALTDFVNQVYLLYLKVIKNANEESALTPKMQKLRQSLQEYL